MPEGYDEQLSRIGGIDLFILASGATDGHIALNPQGTDRDAPTRLVELAEETRRDNLATWDHLEQLRAVPRYGVTVGVGTIRSLSRSVAMVITGAHKAQTARIICNASRYDPDWPATIVTECQNAVIYLDALAGNSISGGTP